ncbi:hypothetical protein FHS20_004883 [Phyllobacterium endophyticum]|nr:hypothetical protein [Phyllobacterium endophyticum]
MFLASGPTPGLYASMAAMHRAFLILSLERTGMNASRIPSLCSCTALQLYLPFTNVITLRKSRSVSPSGEFRSWAM